jgi:ATP-dependent DNA helicase PIF1
MLNEMRFGKMSAQSIAAFKALSREVTYADQVGPTELFPRREDVERSNGTRLKRLTQDGYTYSAADGGALTDPIQREKMLANFMAPSHIELRQGAQVMLIKNSDETLVNGSMGTVIGFIHKELWETDINGKWLRDAEPEGLDDHERETREKIRVLRLTKISAGVKPMPVVRFIVPGGVRDILVEYDVFKVEAPNGETQVSRHMVSRIDQSDCG